MAIEVQTAQNVTIDYEPAGVGYRILAYIVDWIIILIWFFGWLTFLSKLFEDSYSNLTHRDEFWTIFSIFVILPITFYDFLFEVFNKGQSLGKMVFKIRVVNVDGTAPSIGAYLIRWLFRLVDFFLFQWLVGVIMVVATKKSQRLGDYIAGTTVIDLKSNARHKRLTIADLEFHEDYKVTYVDVLDKLSDRDIQTITSIIKDPKMNENEFFVKRLSDRVKNITYYENYGNDKDFLEKIVNDYNYLAIR